MITTSEENAVRLSATKKDFYQIWNELLETASKISERWDPTSTNESDPGIVLLKVLTAIADKLNFEIDANTLECFMPSAAQEESMRKLTEMLGYNMKYFQSATTSVQISYNTYNHDEIDTEVTIDKFTNIKDTEDSINYVTLREIKLNSDQTTKIVDAIEGELVECETDDNNIISIRQLDDNYRYYLPETQIAENGIFITNIDDNIESDTWTKVDNLNTNPARSKVYKFGYDSKRSLPYIQFPADISAIIEDGLKIKYVRTNGVNGNISARTLTKMATPVSWSSATAQGDSKDYYNADFYTATNISAATNGRNTESLTDAYNNYKKIIGTFDTLVTCRDYMNKIYTMMLDNSTPLVSNVIVSDIKDDINKATVLCTFDNYGIAYKNIAKPVNIANAVQKTGSWFENTNPGEGGDQAVREEAYKNDTLYQNTTTSKYVKATYVGNTYKWINVDVDGITNFDLMLYPFRTVYGLNSRLEYVKSFKYDDTNNVEILTGLENNKTISHNIKSPNPDDIACIKNYLRLKAKITTTRKVNKLEQELILNNVYGKLYEAFNMRKIDFGEEISYDSILSVIENADTRIKSVGLEEPELYTAYCLVNGEEYFAPVDDEDVETSLAGKKYYNRTVLNNVLAGRIPLFNYDENFKPDYTEIAYPAWGSEPEDHYEGIYPDATTEIYKLEPYFEIKAHTTEESGETTTNYMSNLKLQDNEVVQFRFPNLKTVETYPAYVNYFLHLNTSKSVGGVGATMYTLNEFLDTVEPGIVGNENTIWYRLANNEFSLQQPAPVEEQILESNWNTIKAASKKIFKNTGSAWEAVETWESGTTYRYFTVTEANLSAWQNFIKARNANYTNGGQQAKIDNIYLSLGVDLSRNVGKYVDESHAKYKVADVISSIPASASKFDRLYVPHTWEQDVLPSTSQSIDGLHTKDGLGKNAVLSDINKDEEYQLQPGDYLLINYTSSKTNDAGEEVKTKINKVFESPVIIRPNFALVDSLNYRTVHSYSKNEGFDFVGMSETIEQPDGMFTLGSDEQIEIRDFVTVELDELATNIYWTRRDEDSLVTDVDSGKLTFKFNEDPVWLRTEDGHEAGEPVDTDDLIQEDENINWIYTGYTLKDGEYLYYTTKDKLDMVGYGSGSKISRTLYTPEIYKFKKDAYISADEISSKGLTAAIPWRPFNFGNSGGKDRHVTISEFKYINLMAGDILNTVVDYESTDTTASDIHMEVIDNTEWRKVKSATYTIDDVPGELPTVTITGGTKCWEVRTKYELNVGPTTVQTLHRTDADNGSYARDFIEVYLRNAADKTIIEDPIVLENKLVDTDYINLSFKTNTLIQYSTANFIDTLVRRFDENGQEIESETTAPLQIKLFKLNDVMAGDNYANIGNFGNGNFTKMSFTNFTRSGAFTTLNLNVPTNRFGLIMFNYIQTTDYQDPTNNVYLKIDGGAELKIYNNNDNWWDGYVEEESGETAKYHLRPGINVIEIPEGGYNLEIYPDTNKHDTIVFSSLDIIYANTDNTTTINPKLQYQTVSEDTVTAQILADINKIDLTHQFYYNAIINNSTDLDLNASDENDNLLSPYSLYEYNNVNNKFVISEIDADWLVDHVVIAKSSKI